MWSTQSCGNAHGPLETPTLSEGEPAAQATVNALVYEIIPAMIASGRVTRPSMLRAAWPMV